MEQQGQNGRREMYILSLDNNRIFWILSIALLVLVFLFLLGYWIGQDNSGGDTQSSTRQQSRSVDDRLGSLRRMLDSRRMASVPAGGNLSGSPAGDLQKKAGTGTDAPDTVKKSSGDPGFKTDNMSPRERRELAMLKKDGGVPAVKKRTPKREIKKNKTRRRVVRKRSQPVARKRTRKRSVYSSRGKYAIQVASLGTSSGASRLRSRLSSRSFRAYISRATVNGKRYYRIKVGRFKSYSRARQVLASLKRTRYGRRSYIVTN